MNVSEHLVDWELMWQCWAAAISELQLVWPVTGSCLCLCVWSRMWHVAHIDCWTNVQFPTVGAKGSETACYEGQDCIIHLLIYWDFIDWGRCHSKTLQKHHLSSLFQPFSSIYYIHAFVRLFYSAFKEYVFITTHIKPLTLLLISLFRVLVELEEWSLLCLRLWWLTAETVQLFWKKCYSSIMYILFINSINRIVFIYIWNLPLFLYFQFNFKS